VLVPGLKSGVATLTIPTTTVDAARAPQAFRVTSTYTTNDGTGERFVSSAVDNYVIDQSPDVGAPTHPTLTSCTLNDFTVDARYPNLLANVCNHALIDERYPVTSIESASTWGGSADPVDGAYLLNVGSTPQAVTRVTLVDPASERKLLGSAGSFLAPLETIEPDAGTTNKQLDAWAGDESNEFARGYREAEAKAEADEAGVTDNEDFVEMKQLYADNGADFSTYYTPAPRTVVPLLVSKVASAPLKLTVSVESFGTPEKSAIPMRPPYILSAAQTDGKPGTPVGTSSVDAGALLNPFIAGSTAISWPGTKAVALDPALLFTYLGMQFTGEVDGGDYRVSSSSSQGRHATLEASGYEYPVPDYGAEVPNLLKVDADPTKPGVESVYAAVSGTTMQKVGAEAVPVGGFDAKALSVFQSSLSYVPLGAYQSLSSTLADGKKLRSSVSGLGVASPKTVAIASIHSAGAWGDATPIGAVRVRVAGISAYTPLARQRVVEVASAIAKLGFRATIVAGSSPTDVQVTVKGYAFGAKNSTDRQRVGTVGSLIQRWSELGAAGRADLAVSTGSLSVLALALGSTAILLGAVQFASVPRRRGQAAILREVGWTRWRIRRWMAAEEVPSWIIVLGAGSLAVVLSGVGRVSVTVAAVAVGAVVVSSTIAVSLGSRSHRPTAVRTPSRSIPRHSSRHARRYARRHARRDANRRASRYGSRTPRTFGVRQASIHLVTTVTSIAAVTVVSVSAAALVDVVIESQRRAGASALARFAAAQASVPQFALGTVGLLAGIVLVVLARRIDLTRRAPQWSAMRSMGWTVRDLRSAQRAEAVVVSVPGIVLGAIVTAAGANFVGATSPLLLVATSLLAAVVVAASVLVVSGRADS
jgi:hypothetical protein